GGKSPYQPLQAAEIARAYLPDRLRYLVRELELVALRQRPGDELPSRPAHRLQLHREPAGEDAPQRRSGSREHSGRPEAGEHHLSTALDGAGKDIPELILSPIHSLQEVDIVYEEQVHT